MRPQVFVFHRGHLPLQRVHWPPELQQVCCHGEGEEAVFTRGTVQQTAQDETLQVHAGKHER